jgi:hypothetical protein
MPRRGKSVAAMSATAIELIVERFSGRRIGSGRWIARCPSHHDRSPSLSIASGRDGRVLLRCFAGCELSDVLRSAGLKIDNLFPGPPPAPEQLAAAAAEHDRQLEASRAQRTQERAAVDWLRAEWQRLDQSVPQLARELMMMPDGAVGEKTLTAHFHGVLARQRFIDRAFIGEAEWF